jgi:hypothetical protein
MPLELSEISVDKNKRMDELEVQDINRRIDELEANMLENFDMVNCPVIHSFIPGFYCRQIFMPAGTLITSLIHKTKHTYQITQGIVKVKINEHEWKTLESGHAGVTEPGTRRILFIEEPCVWTTFHPILEHEYPVDNTEESKEIAVELIGERIIEKHENSLLGGVLKNNVIIKQIKETERINNA